MDCHRFIVPVGLKVIGAIYLLTLCNVATAQVTPPMEYEKYVDKGRSIQPLGDSPFGEQIGLYGGSLSFQQTDLELPGTGPTIKIVRSFQLRESDKTNDSSGIGFLDWELEIPRIRTITADHLSGIYTVQGWQVDSLIGSNNRYKRCSLFGPPPELVYDGDSFAKRWAPDDWWDGYRLVDMDGSEQSMLQRDPSQLSQPQSYGTTYPLTTKNNWMISCLSNTSNGEPGEAFLALAPDGTRYWFNYLVYTPASTLYTNAGLPLARRYGAMLVTRIEDRFGNSLTYNYQADKLTSISASDGRHISIAYNNGRIGSITAVNVNVPSRTWNYEYSTGYGLTAVVNPDTSRWLFNLGQFSGAPTLGGGGNCDELGSLLSTTPINASITAPSGLTGSFTLEPRKHGRSFVYRQCWEHDPEIPDSGFAVFPKAWYAYTLTRRSITGPGVPLQVWDYSYSPANESWEHDCSGQVTCLATIWVDITNPQRERTRHVFSNRFDRSETLELRTEVYPQDATSHVQAIDNIYAIGNANEWWSYPWPEFAGWSAQSRDNPWVTSARSPLRKRTITQDSRVFVWEANAFDAYARPTQVTKSSAPAP